MLRPILFNTQMVQAILEGRKTATRRLMSAEAAFACENHEALQMHVPFQAGDVLWVRETWGFWPCIGCDQPSSSCYFKPSYLETADGKTEGCYLYRADGDEPVFSGGHIWRPSIHMPRDAARIFLRVKAVNAARLQKSFRVRPSPIREYMAEGIRVSPYCRECLPKYDVAPCERQREVQCIFEHNAERAFAELWDSTIPQKRLDKQGWAADPWVWVIRFEPCEKPKRWPI